MRSMEQHPAPTNPAPAAPAPRAAGQLPPARSRTAPKRKRRHPAKRARRVATAVSASAAVLMVGGMAYSAQADQATDSAEAVVTTDSPLLRNLHHQRQHVAGGCL